MTQEANYLAKAEMLIRKPISEVYHAFIDPKITTKFWFTKSSGILEVGKKIDWTWEMYDLTIPVQIKSMEHNKSILVDWGTGEQQSTVKWMFKELGNSKTFLTIVNYNFQGSEKEQISKVIDSTGGFTMVIAGLKSWLEHGVELNLIGDKFPTELTE